MKSILYVIYIQSCNFRKCIFYFFRENLIFFSPFLLYILFDDINITFVFYIFFYFIIILPLQSKIINVQLVFLNYYEKFEILFFNINDHYRNRKLNSMLQLQKTRKLKVKCNLSTLS